MMNFAGPRRQAALTAPSQMIIVGANHNGFILQLWITAREDADDVEGRRLATNDLGVEIQLECSNRKLAGISPVLGGFPHICHLLVERKFLTEDFLSELSRNHQHRYPRFTGIVVREFPETFVLDCFFNY